MTSEFLTSVTAIMPGEFSRRLENRGGYDTSDSGMVKYGISGQEKDL
ncbi:MAG: hypothetical protein H6Q52_1491 [Deltaproteobacteria bacterium]|nr:hypothetical protein [Deltaproteobacteria bacterium]